MPCPHWLCNKVLKPYFQSIISQTLILAKLLLLRISCENVFALSVVTALTACHFSIKKFAQMSVFYVKTAKICWRLGATPPHPVSLRRLVDQSPAESWMRRLAEYC